MTERTYDDSCGLARALDVLGERWTLLIVRELLLGPKRFVDLRAGLPTMSQNVLTRRVREMEQAGLVARILLPPPANAPAYRLTARGLQLRPALIELSRWGAFEPMPPRTDRSPAAMLLALSALYDASRIGAVASGVLTIGRESFTLTATPDGLDIQTGAATSADFHLTGTVEALQGVLLRGAAAEDLEAGGELTVTGDRASIARLSRCFPAPVLMPQE